MRLSVDAHAIGRHLTGNEVYVRSLLKSLVDLDRDSDFIAYISSPEAAAWLPEGVRGCQVSTSPFIRLGWQLRRRLLEDQPDLLHVQYTAPLACPVPVVVSVHDVSFLEHPRFFPAARVFQLQRTVGRTVRKAEFVLAPSEFSRRRIIKAYGIDGGKVVVAPNAAASTFRPISRDKAKAGVAKSFGLRTPFILFVGDLTPRKNPDGLIRAFTELLKNTPGLPHHLVFAGQDGWRASVARDAASSSGLAERIHFLGFVSDADLLQLYNACELFVFPSWYEGFGIPVLEAMACGRAVACSNASALPEVADGAALFFDPSSASAMAGVMRELLIDPQLRQRMERLGLQRSTHFRWEDSARRTLEVYGRVVEARSPQRVAVHSLPARPA